MHEHAHTAPALPLDPREREPLPLGDALGSTNPVVPLRGGGWMVLGHEEAVRVADDPQTFSSAVSAHLQIPNGLDGPTHRAFREVTDPFFTEPRMAELEPRLQEIAAGIVQELGERPRGSTVDAVRAQTAWLGWPRELEPRLLAWMDENHETSRAGDPARTAQVAEAFDAIIREIVDPLLAGEDRDTAADADAAGAASVTAELLQAEVHLPGEDPRRLTHEEIVSVLRNWTAGDLGSIALCVGVVLEALARTPVLADRIRGGASRREVAAIIDELLRRDDPFVSNRRVATCPVELSGTRIEPGQRVVIQWTSANRDARTFPEPDQIHPYHNAAGNLVYGIGPHVCPGRPLATLELCVITEAIVRAFSPIELDPGIPVEREVTHLGGFASIGLRLGGQAPA